MIIYRIEFYDPVDGSAGYAFTRSLRGAQKVSTNWLREANQYAKLREEDIVTRTNNPKLPRTVIEPLPVTPTKDGLVKFLNMYAAHPDNG